nr:hypothetical protein [Tanacetum cinerariifolium]
TETIPTSTPTEIPTLRQYSRRARIAQSITLPTAADERASPLGDVSQGEAFSTISGLEAGQDRENIIKTSTLPPQELEISSLKERIKLPEDKDKGTAEQSRDDAPIKGRSLETWEEAGVEKSTERGKQSRDDAPIKGRSLETWEEAGVEKSTERGSNDTEELVNVLTSLDAANILTSGV